MDDTFEVFVVYENPLDYPGRHVVRRQVLTPENQIVADPEPLAVVSTLAEARAALPRGLTRIGRDNRDDLCIVEVWI